MLNMAQIIGLIKRFGGGGTGGGGGVQPDWNQNDPAAADYVKNRTHYSEEILDVVLPEATIPKKAAYLNDYTSYTRNLVKGHVYNVICDGVEYQCSPVWNDILSSYTIGNASLAGFGDDTGEPFFINSQMNTMMTAVYFAEDGTHTISINEGVIETIHPLDPKYLPPDITIPSGGSLTIKEGATVNDEAGVLGGSGGAFVVNIIGTRTGTTNVYTFDKTYEEIRAAYDNGLSLVANAKIPFSDNQYGCTLLPLDLSESDFEYNEMSFGGYVNTFNTCVRITICENGDIYDNMTNYTLPIPLLANGTMMVVKDRKWVAVNAPVVYSPGGKCFKITVDDSGTLTATEVTT